MDTRGSLGSPFTSISTSKKTVINNTEPASSTGGTRLPPDFKQVHKYLKDISQREHLEEYIKVGWTPAELAEYARLFQLPSKTFPTASAYQIALGFGPDSATAKIILKDLRAPGHVMPPFDRPVPPPPIPLDDPDSPEHTREFEAEVDQLARMWRARSAHQYGRPLPDRNASIHKGLWKRCYRLRNRYSQRSLDSIIGLEGLRDYA